MWKKQVLQDRGYVHTVKACCMLHAMMQGAILLIFIIYVDTDCMYQNIKLQCRFLYEVFKLHENLIKTLELL